MHKHIRTHERDTATGNRPPVDKYSLLCVNTENVTAFLLKYTMPGSHVFGRATATSTTALAKYKLLVLRHYSEQSMCAIAFFFGYFFRSSCIRQVPLAINVIVLTYSRCKCWQIGEYSIKR